MPITIVKLVKDFGHWHGDNTLVGRIGYIIDNTPRPWNEREIAVEFFNKEGENKGTVYNIPVNCIQLEQSHEAYEAFCKYYDKPYIHVEAEFVMQDRSSYGVWLVVGKPVSGWLNYKHRLLGSEDLKNPNELVEYWDAIARRMDVALLVDPYVQALCLDHAEGDTKLTHYMTMWAKRVQAQLKQREKDEGAAE